MTDTVITGNSGAVATNVIVGGDFYQNVTIAQHVQDFMRARRLDGDRARALLRTYEPPPGHARAAETLDRRNAVVLVGREGTGRRTTAIALLAARNLTLRELTPESADDTSALPCDPGCGYLFGIDALDAAIDLEDYVARLRAQGSRLVVWTTRDVTCHLGTFQAGIAVELREPAPDRVFGRMLNAALRPDEAAWWLARDDLRQEIVKDARPAGVARLVELIRMTMAVRGCDDTAVAEVVQAYRNWDGYLQDRFGRSGIEPRARLFLITVAALQGAPEGVVYEAATVLGETLGIAPEEGRGLAGEGVRGLTAGAEVIRDDDGAVRFTKPAFAESVLDYVRRVYPPVWDHVRAWALALPGGLRDRTAPERIAQTLAEAAIRHRDLALVQQAVGEWSAAPATRPLAVEVLSMAAVARGLGRPTRRWMYDCAYDRTGPAGRLVAIAETCAQYGTVYPENALVRLRHLAAADSEPVCRAVRQAVTRLAGHDDLRARVLDAVVEWAKNPKHRETGCGAFLDIAGTRDVDGRLAVLDRATPRRAERLRSALGQGWQAALIAPATAEHAHAVLAAWLDDALAAWEAAGREHPLTGTVITVLGRAAREDARYLPRLARAVDQWYGQAAPAPARDVLRRAVVSAATANDPLASILKGAAAR